MKKERDGTQTMSFALELKKELIHLPVKVAQRRRMLALGILLDAVADQVGQTVCVRLADEEIAEATEKLLGSVFGKAPSVASVRGVGRTCFEVTLCSRQAVELLTGWENLGAVPENELWDPDASKCFLRGAFIGCGTATDPAKPCHWEFDFRNPARAVLLEPVLKKWTEQPPKVIDRANGRGVYYKNKSAVSNLLGAIGANRTLFDWLNDGLETEARKSEQRLANCDTGNISRSVEATHRQLQAIRFLQEHEAYWLRLPENLRKTATLRLENPDISLTELALLHEPVISKSGLNHRLQKMTELAREYREAETDAALGKTEETNTTETDKIGRVAQQ